MLFVGLLWSAFAVVALSDTDVDQTVRDVTTTKSGAKWCPMPVVGTECPASSIFHYYACCGSANKDCCFNLQLWVIVVLAVIAVIMLASFVISILRCLFCRR
ncbi:unnamed protein product [Thelazia callipaeda]|uniref:Uncharacterized protein n=1 Tax=Thelazia callipaeda TaxID=103827 RepID=A0A0N5CY70_THECL|nr:unnamed protein product [Thelazia callipaeda]